VNCCAVQTVNPRAAVAPAVPKILASGTFTSPKTGRRYAWVETNERGSEVEFERELVLPRALARRPEAAPEDFNGTDRRDAKTSIGTGDVEDIGSLDDVLSGLKSDDEMLNRVPPITRAADSERVDPEQRNVHVSAFLYATKRETDHDYHLILGSQPSAASSQFMTAEVSGLPTEGDRAKLTIPRQAFENHFASQPIGSNYRKFDPPIPVDITGSLFFDVDHLPGEVGPDGMKPRTSWEIHPITKIAFESGGDQ
jgi:hypothetical protein